MEPNQSQSIDLRLDATNCLLNNKMNNLLFEKVKNCKIDDLLELLVNEKETVKFDILVYSIIDFDKFEILYNVLLNEIDLTQNSFFLFKSAVLNSNLKVVSFLLQNGFNVEECLDMALKEIVTLTSVGIDTIPILQLLLDYNVDVTKNDNFAICAVSKKYPGLYIFKLLESHGADISAQSNCPLKNAVNRGNIDLIWYLIKSGIDYRTENDYVLRCCCFYNNYDLVYFLINSGANVESFTTLNKIFLIMNTDIKIIRLLLENGLQINNLKTSDIEITKFSFLYRENDLKNSIMEKYKLLVDNYGMDPLIFTLIHLC